MEEFIIINIYSKQVKANLIYCILLGPHCFILIQKFIREKF